MMKKNAKHLSKNATRTGANPEVPSPYNKMTEAELKNEFAKYDAENGVDADARPLNAAERAMHVKAACRGRGRPVVGEGAEKIRISIERGLPERVDELARRESISRSQLIADGLLLKLAAAGST